MRRLHRPVLSALLVVLLPLAATSACGVAKKRSVEQEFRSAQSNLGKAKAATFTLGLRDSDGTLEKTFRADADPDDGALVQAVLGGSVSYTVDPAGAKTLAAVDTTCDPDDVSSQLKDVNAQVSISSDQGTLAELRLVEGELFVRVGFDEVRRLAKTQGTDLDAEYDAFVADAPAELQQGLQDAYAGKWLSLKLADYLDAFVGLAQSFSGIAPPGAQPSADPCAVDTSKLGQDLFDAVKAHVDVKAANDDEAHRVLDVAVDARGAAKAALQVLKASKDLPFAQLFGEVGPADVDEAIPAGTVKGQIVLGDGHLEEVSLDLESIRVLVAPDEDDVKGAAVVVKVDDSADEVQAPTSDLSSFDVGDLIDSFLDDVEAGFGQAA